MSSFESSAAPASRDFVARPITGAAAFVAAVQSAAAAPAAPADDGPVPADVPDVRPASEAELAARYEKGLADGRAEAEEALAAPLAALERAARLLAEQRDAWLHAQRTAVVELALAIAGRIVEREIAADPRRLAELVGRAIRRLEPGAPVVVQLARADLSVASGRRPALAALAADEAVRLEAAADLGSGEARVRSDATTIDATLTGLLARFREELLPLVDAVGAADDGSARGDEMSAGGEAASARGEAASARGEMESPDGAEQSAEPTDADPSTSAMPDAGADTGDAS